LLVTELAIKSTENTKYYTIKEVLSITASSAKIKTKSLFRFEPV